jgi:hypothetical protein
LAKLVRTVINCPRRRVFLHLVRRRCFLEIVNSMRLKSALEDFETNTLSAVSGALCRLSYVGNLRDGNGKYEHWGLAKVYGEAAAQSALGASHRVALSAVLKKPLAALLNELAVQRSEHPAEEGFLTSLAQPLPKPFSSAAQAHLKSVLSALSALAESRNVANPRSASPPRQPGQGPQPPVDV